MAKCWETRGCDQEMQDHCVHAEKATEKCPSRCAFATCYREVHEVTSDPALIFAPDIDRTGTIKEACTFCAFFLTHGPRTS